MTSKPLTASAFIRSLPATTPAAEVAKAGAAKGLKFSVTLVYMVRSAARRKAGKGAAPKKGTARRSSNVASSTEAQFKKAALEIGIASARTALDELERGLAALLV